MISLSPPDIIKVQLSLTYFKTPLVFSTKLSLSLCTMDRVRLRFNRDPSRESKGSVTLQKKLAMEAQRKTEQVPDLTDFMNDMFFGTVNVESSKKVYNLTGGGCMDENYDFESSTKSNSSRQTQEWLEEAKRMVASSPSRSETPPRFIGSPRFVAAHGSPSLLDRRDPLSRSARRYKIAL